MPANDLYANYLRFMEDARRALLPLLSDPASQQHFQRIHRVLSREQFEACLARPAAGPSGENDLRNLLRRGFQWEVTPPPLPDGGIAPSAAATRSAASPL